MTRERIIQSVWSDVQKMMPEHVARLGWSQEQVRAHQTDALRRLLRTAKDHTRYYGEALSDVDVDNFSLEDLHRLPPHDKIAHMERWDDFIAAPGITYDIAEKHVDAVRTGAAKNPFYQNEYLFVATGGSTGKRGLFVWDLEFLRQIICFTYRCLINDEQKRGYNGSMKMATVEAPTLLHGSGYVFPSKPSPEFELLKLASTDPVPEACAKLNDFRPDYLMAYASSVAELASAQLRGELDIHPRWVCTNSGPQDEDIRDRSMKAWGVKASNSWGCVEIGQMAVETEAGTAMVICEDGAVLEVVDRDNHPVRDVRDAAKVLATNLTNLSLPMIRYEVDDIIETGVSLPGYPGYGTVSKILGKATNWFLYGGIKVHPTSFSDILETEKEVDEFQIVQTRQGAHIKIVSGGEPDIRGIKSTIAGNLNKYGLRSPELTFEIVESLPHHPETGKIKRFIPLEK